MKSLWLIVAFGAIFFVGGFADYLYKAARRPVLPYGGKKEPLWWDVEWDAVLRQAIYGALFGASLAALRLLLF